MLVVMVVIVAVVVMVIVVMLMWVGAADFPEELQYTTNTERRGDGGGKTVADNVHKYL